MRRAPTPELLARIAAAPGWVLDVDGCLVRTAKAGGAGGAPIPGAIDFVNWLQAQGRQVIVCTNASERPLARYAAHLRDIGLNVADDQMITAATAAARHIRAIHGEGPVVALGAEGLFEALHAAGVRLAGPNDQPAAIIVGAAESYASADINAACLAIADHAAAFYVTVDTPWFYGVAGRSVASSTAIARAIQGITGAAPIVCGKPSKVLAAMLRARLGGAGADIVVVGDMASIEIRMAREMGAFGVLVFSGGAAPSDLASLIPGDQPHLTANHVGELLKALLAVDGGTEK